jgi:hypothetical protein
MLAAQLDGGFQAGTDLDFKLAGTATVVDTQKQLVVDQLSAGSWTGSPAMTATFTGTRQP